MGHGYESVKSRHLFRGSIDATAHIEIGTKAFSVHFEKRAHNPLLVATGFDLAPDPWDRGLGPARRECEWGVPGPPG